jgi:hypothetical protein
MKTLAVLGFLVFVYALGVWLRWRAMRDVLELKDPPVVNCMAEWPWKVRK